MGINKEMKALNKRIDELLAERRPDRYTVRDSVSNTDEDVDVDEVTTTAWLDGVAADVQDLVPDEETRRLFARQVVGQREGRATRRANDLLRKINREGQLPLSWMDASDWPISVITRVAEPGERVKVVDERVALRAGWSEDFRKFATEERRRAAGDFSARNEACEGAEWVADQMDLSGAVNFRAWAEQVAPPPSPDDEQDDT